VSQRSRERGFSCDGYVYGWNVCTLTIRADEDSVNDDRVIGPFFQHGGGYLGVRSLMTVAPRLGFGVAFLSNSDSMTGFLGLELTKVVFERHEDLPGGDRSSPHRRSRLMPSTRSHLCVGPVGGWSGYTGLASGTSDADRLHARPLLVRPF
jgi:hypothetical protein